MLLVYEMPHWENSKYFNKNHKKMASRKLGSTCLMGSNEQWIKFIHCTECAPVTWEGIREDRLNSVTERA